MSPWRAAIDKALLLHNQPSFAAGFRKAALPDGMSVLIRLASDEGSRRKDLAQLLECEESHLQKIAAEYLLTICLFPGSDDLRTLGLNSSADLSTAKEHHRLLLKWLHPDRNPDNQAYAERVNQAWAALKNAAKHNPVPSPAYSRPALDVAPPVPPSGRFPLFLWGLVGLAILLLVISALPDAEVYVADAGSSAKENSKRIDSEQTNANQDNQLESRLQALGLTFSESQNIKKTSQPVETAAEKDRQPVAKQTEKAKQPVTKRSEIAQVLPNKPSSPAPVAKPEKPQVVVIGETALAEKKPVQAATVAPNPRPRVKMDAEQIPAATNPLPAVSPGRNLQAEGQALVSEFRQRYKQGNSTSFMQLFGSSASNNRGDRRAIEADYARLFVNTSSRKIDFSHSKWIFREDVIQFKAVYEATVRRKGDILPVISKGRIDLIMSLENDALRVQQILLNE